MQLSVVILNYNVRYFLQQCVLSVQAAIRNIDAEIIVVDNNSPDDSREMMRSLFPDITLIDNTQNAGFPKGNNMGVEKAKGKYICILNPDTVVAEDTFEKVLAFADSKVDPGVIGVRLIDGAGRFLPESKRGIPTPFTALTKITGLHKISPKLFGKYYASHLSENETGQVEILVGAFMLMRKDVYCEAGGFDEDCFMYSDDIDLSYTILKTGRSNYYFADTTVIHYKGESTVRDGLYMKRFREAMDFFYRKHFRKSVFFDIFMKAGTFIFSIIKKRQAVVTKRVPGQYVLISEDKVLHQKIEAALKKNVSLVKPSGTRLPFISEMEAKSTEIIFDNAAVSNREIIEIIRLGKSEDMLFRIIPKGCDFLIGSDSSNDRGEVIRLN